ncbi:MAG TPA: hypothetical protein VMI54_09185 [Polyangiaceae bacterium]|nr:hypothetical protein [Polyangiaceae bacterium]
MSRVSHLRLKRAVTYVPLAIIGAAFLFTLSGCPGGADLEDPAKFGIAGAPVTGSGGTTGGTGGTSTGATGGTGGSTGGTTGGSAGTSTSGGTLTVNCTGTTYDVALKSCNTLGCHASSYPSAGLNLTADSGLVGRLKDVPSKHTDIDCGNGVTCTTTPTTCPSGDFLVDSSNYANSWLLKKIDESDPMCGVQMPDASAYKTANDKACLEAMVQAIAMLPK